MRGGVTAGLLILAAAAAFDGGSPAAGGKAGREYEVKAAFIYNFARFVEWPDRAFESPEAPIVVGILRRDPFGNALARALDGKTVNGRSFVIRRYARLMDLEPPAVLFLGGTGLRTMQTALTLLRGSPVLTVCETGRFDRLGGIVGFFVEDRRVRFVIDVRAAERAGLRISSRLLELSQAAHDPFGPGDL